MALIYYGLVAMTFTVRQSRSGDDQNNHRQLQYQKLGVTMKQEGYKMFTYSIKTKEVRERGFLTPIPTTSHPLFRQTTDLNCCINHFTRFVEPKIPFILNHKNPQIGRKVLLNLRNKTKNLKGMGDRPRRGRLQNRIQNIQKKTPWKAMFLGGHRISGSAASESSP